MAGTVEAAATGGRIAFARILVDGRSSTVIAREDGSFRITGLRAGAHTLLVRQIGFTPLLRQVVIGAQDSLPVSVTIRLVHLPAALDTMHVASGPCTTRGFSNAGAQDVAQVFEQMALNVDQYHTLAAERPMTPTYDRRRWLVTYRGEVAEDRRDTVTYGHDDPDSAYAVGRVFHADTAADGRVSYDMNVPNFGDLASTEFQNHHCFRYAGTETVDGHRVYRIDFVPTQDVKTTDVRGSAYLDASSYLLRNARFEVLNLPRGLHFHDVEATATFREVLPFYVVAEGLDATQQIEYVRTAVGDPVTEGKQANRLMSFSVAAPRSDTTHSADPARAQGEAPAPVVSNSASVRLFVLVIADSVNRIAGAEVSAIRGLNSVVAHGVTDAFGRATLLVPRDTSDIDVVARKIGFLRGEMMIGTPARDTTVTVVLHPAPQVLATVQVDAQEDERHKRLFIDADAIENSPRPVLDGVDVITHLRPDMAYGLGGKGYCPRIQHVWVNGEEIFPEFITIDEAATARARGNLTSAQMPRWVISLLAHVHPEHIAEMHEQDCMNVAAGKDKFNAIFITLKPGVSYDPAVGTYIGAKPGG